LDEIHSAKEEPTMPSDPREKTPASGGKEPGDVKPRLNPGDEARPGTPGSGEDVCPDCRGSGRLEGRACPTCGGTGKVIQGIGGG
jgi:hypothetical protein